MPVRPVPAWVVLRWEASYGRAYQIQVADNASSWTTISTVANGDGGVDDLTVSGSGRYVRMYGTQRVTVGAAWHTYAVEWDPTFVKWLIDDQLVRTVTHQDVIANYGQWVYDNPKSSS